MTNHIRLMLLRGCVVVALLAGPATPSGATETSHRAAHIAYRLEVELGPIDAAQRHVLIARLILALESGDLDPAVALRDRALSWEQRIEAREQQLSLSRPLIPSWTLTPVDAVDLILAGHAPADGAIDFPDPLWDGRRASAAVKAITDSDSVVSAIAYANTLSWAAGWAPELWSRLLTLLTATPEWQPLVAPLIEPWLALDLAAPLAQWEQLTDQAAVDLRNWKGGSLGGTESIVGDAVASLDSELITRATPSAEFARRALFRAFWHQRFDAVDRAVLSVAVAISQIPDGAYPRLLLSLFELGALLEAQQATPQQAEQLAGVLAALEGLQSRLLPAMDHVDPRLGQWFQQARALLRSRLAQGFVADGKVEAFMQWASLTSAARLETDGLDGYLAQPFREAFRNDFTICGGMSRAHSGWPPEPIDQVQFDACQQALANWGAQAALGPELAGAATGPFEPEHLQRESRLSPWQRINYWKGYLAQLAGCEIGEESIANPLEWAIAARAVVWFARQWPQLEQQASIAAINSLVETGRKLRATLDAMRRCAQADEPLGGAMLTYLAGTEMVRVALDQATSDFRQRRLAEGADIDPSQGASQPTQFRPVERPVLACDEASSCGITAPLEASRALYGLFEAPYLVAHQSGYGAISLCYRDVTWIDRRAELPTGRPPAMADYYGRLAFTLEGRLSNLEAPLFQYRMTSDSEHLYLFGANDEEVLSDACPLERLDKQVKAELPERTFQLVPRRLTFMTAERASPGKLVAQHWIDGEQWRDRFATGQVEPLGEPIPSSTILEDLESHMTVLYREWNDDLFRQMLTQDLIELDSDLYEAIDQLEMGKRAAASLARIVAVDELVTSPALRASIFGDDGLIDRASILRLKQENHAAIDVAPLAAGRYQEVVATWKSESGMFASDAVILATMLDLAALSDEIVVHARLRQSP